MVVGKEEVRKHSFSKPKSDRGVIGEQNIERLLEIYEIFSRPYPVPKVHKEMFKNKVESLVLLGVLERANDS